jgi:hypothetical protein
MSIEEIKERAEWIALEVKKALRDDARVEVSQGIHVYWIDISASGRSVYIEVHPDRLAFSVDDEDDDDDQTPFDRPDAITYSKEFMAKLAIRVLKR